MKKQISKKLSAFMFAILACILIFNGFAHFNNAESEQTLLAISTVEQIEEILISNEEDLAIFTESLQDEYIIKVQMAAYILENVEITTEEEFDELVSLLNIDELHVFTEDGIIYNGSESKYFGYSFNSGEQMSFFLPMLEDKTLTMCQDITPNTAEEKPMMYVATWNSSGTEIIQIGLEPDRILERQSQMELSYVFSNMPTDTDTTLIAIEASTCTIVGSSNEDYLYLSCYDIGLDISEMNFDKEMFYIEVDDVNSLCVFAEYGDTYFGMIISKSLIYYNVLDGIIAINFYFMIAAVFLYFALIRIIDATILKNIDRLIYKVNKIAGGDLDIKVAIDTSPEFSKLSAQLNMMVTSLINTTTTISHILDYVDTNIAVYEYKKDMNKVFATRKIATLLDIDSEDFDKLLNNKELFEDRIQNIKRHQTDEKHIYQLENGLFIKIETLSSEDEDHGVIIDVSDITNEKKQLEYERDYDSLTDLYNRRAFFREIEKLFTQTPDKLKNYSILALDMDNLKPINDTYGHSAGDAAIQYSAQMLKNIGTDNKILCRLGGDEFVAIIFGEDEPSQIFELIQSLRASFNHAYITANEQQIPIKMSAGYVINSDVTANYHHLLKRADETLYLVKKNQKNSFLEYKQ